MYHHIRLPDFDVNHCSTPHTDGHAHIVDSFCTTALVNRVHATGIGYRSRVI